MKRRKISNMKSLLRRPTTFGTNSPQVPKAKKEPLSKTQKKKRTN